MSARPKSSGEEKSARPVLKPGEKVIPHDELKQAVFDNIKKAQAVFKSMDKDKDKKLSEVEFCKGFKDFMEEFNISDAAVKALWNQTDTNLDGFVTWDEFRIRLVEDASINYHLRQELPELPEDMESILQGVRPLIVAMHKPDVRTDAQTEMLKKISLDEGSKFTLKNFKALCDTLSSSQREACLSKGDPAPAWTEFWGDYSKEQIAELHEQIELKDNGKLKLDRLQRRLGHEHDIAPVLVLNYKKRLQEVKLKGKDLKTAEELAAEEPPPSTRGSARPGTGDKKGEKGVKKPKVTTITLKTLLPVLQLEWLSFEVFSELLKDLTDFPLRAAPSLKTWTASELERWGLENSVGDRCHIFLTDHVQVKKIIKDEETKLPVVYMTFRTELNGLHTQEWFYHAKLWLDKHENVKKLQYRPTKAYRDGLPCKLKKGYLRDFADWLEQCPVPDDDGSLIKPKDF